MARLTGSFGSRFFLFEISVGRTPHVLFQNTFYPRSVRFAGQNTHGVANLTGSFGSRLFLCRGECRLRALGDRVYGFHRKGAFDLVINFDHPRTPEDNRRNAIQFLGLQSL